jgi:putative ABC transport system permease protein
VLTGFLFGFAPALHIARTDVQEVVKESGRGTAGSARNSRLRHALIIAEVALSVVLLAGAGLLFRSFLRLQAVNVGFTPQQLLTARMVPSGPEFKMVADYVKFYDQVLARVRAIPGVQQAGLINVLPLRKGPTVGFRIEGRPILPADKWVPTNFRSVSPGYFQAMNIPILQGRAFTEQDDGNARAMVMINQALAERDFPGENAVGKRLTLKNTTQNGQPVWFEIIGVTANVRSTELREEAPPDFYFTTEQSPLDQMTLVIRSTQEPGSLAPSLRQAVAEINKSVPLSDIQTMDHIVSESVTQPRFNVFLLGLFSGIALLLSAAGIYGVTAYTVTQRTQELGIRLALGAQVRDILKMILGQGMIVIGIGLVIGLAAAVALTRLMRSLLFGIGETDPVTFGAITLVLLLVALAACYLPARRAAKVDPLIALRYE